MARVRGFVDNLISVIYVRLDFGLGDIFRWGVSVLLNLFAELGLNDPGVGGILRKSMGWMDKRHPLKF